MIDGIRQLKNPKVQLLLLLVALAVMGLVNAVDWQMKLVLLATSVAAAVLAEWAFFGAVPLTSVQSAAISGSIIGMLVAPGSNLLFAWSASVAAIASKKLLVFQERRHIFNPAAVGLMFSLMIFGNQINWWGNSSVILVIAGAGLILFRLHRLSLPFSYFIARTAGAFVVAGHGADLGLFLLPNIFFAFIMLVEPMTSPGKWKEQWIFGGLCGILATVFHQFLPSFEGDLLALLTANLLRPLLAFRPYELNRQHSVNGAKVI